MCIPGAFHLFHVMFHVIFPMQPNFGSFVQIFRESKESEIRDLLKAKEKLERALHHVDPEALLEMKGKDLAEEG